MQKETKEAIVVLAATPGWSTDRIVKAFGVFTEAEVIEAISEQPRDLKGEAAAAAEAQRHLRGTGNERKI